MIEDSTLGLTEAVWVGPESKHVYVGSPTILKVPMPGGTARWLVAHDFFGASTLNATVQVGLCAMICHVMCHYARL